MRVFAFGCSLTQYFFPTWADIIIKQYRDKGHEGSNWAKSGAGNMYINMRLWEANTIHKFNKDDVILLQWSSMFREDRYHMGKGWWTPGNFSNLTQGGHAFMLNNYYYDDPWIWADMIHCVMRDCAMISSTHKALEAIGCTVHSTAFREPIEGWEELPNTFSNNEKLELEDVNAVLNAYKDDIKTKHPPILNALNFDTSQEFFDDRPKSVPTLREEHSHMLLPEVHPLTHEAAEFVDTHVIKLEESTWDWVNDWKAEYIDKDPIVLEDLRWFNPEKIGWSDDRWRP